MSNGRVSRARACRARGASWISWLASLLIKEVAGSFLCLKASNFRRSNTPFWAAWQFPLRRMSQNCHRPGPPGLASFLFIISSLWQANILTFFGQDLLTEVLFVKAGYCRKHRNTIFRTALLGPCFLPTCSFWQIITDVFFHLYYQVWSEVARTLDLMCLCFKESPPKTKSRIVCWTFHSWSRLLLRCVSRMGMASMSTWTRWIGVGQGVSSKLRFCLQKCW